MKFITARAVHPHWFIPVVLDTLSTPTSPPKNSPFMHDLSKEAIIYNSRTLKKHDCNVEKMINSHPESELSCGSEFLSRILLRKTSCLHSLWDQLKLSSIVISTRHFFPFLSRLTRQMSRFQWITKKPQINFAKDRNFIVKYGERMSHWITFSFLD